MVLELRTKEILNKTRTNFALKQKQILLSFLVIIIFGGNVFMGSRGLYGDIERSYNNNIKTSHLKSHQVHVYVHCFTFR